jgi:hypothetical protein
MIHQLTKNKEKILLNKLRRPLHISYIAESILGCSEYQAKEILKEYIEQDILEEVKTLINFYRVKSNDNER